MRLRLDRVREGYALAVGGTCLAAWIRWELSGVFEEDLPPYLTFYPAIIVSALLGGTGAGLLATILSVGFVDYLFLPPFGFGIERAGGIAGMVLFTGINVLMSFMGGALHNARHRTEESELQHRQTLESILSHISVVNQSGQILAVNRAWTEFAENNGAASSPSVAVGSNYLDVCRRAAIQGNTDAEQALAGIEAVINGAKDQFTLEYACHSPDAQRWFVMSVVPYGSTGAVITHSNITARKRMEEALTASEARLHATFNGAGVGFVEVGDDNRFAAVNERACEILGRSSQELLGMNVNDITLSEDRALSDRANAEVRSGVRNHVDYEKRYIRRDGTPVWVHVTISGIFDEQGRWVRSVTTIQDISDRKRAEARLQSEKEFSDTAINSLPGIFVLFDTEQRLVRWNDNLERVTGYSSEAISNMAALDFIAPEDRPLANERIRLVFSTGEAAADLHMLTKDGRRIPYSYTGKRFEFGGKVCLVAVGLDTTERTLAEAALAEMNATLDRLVQERTSELQEAMSELEHFSYTITHDMRAPLRAMKGFGSILLTECGECLNPTRFDFLRRITDSAERMDHLITDALKYSRAVQTRFELKPVDAAHLIRGIVESYPQLQPPLAEIDIHDPLPAVMGNEAALTQCFSNLLDNAAKFVAPNTTPQVRIWAEHVRRTGGGLRNETGEEREHDLAAPDPPRELVRFWVEDNGIGIDPNDRDKIFVMFQKLDKSYEGTGIGLALVRKVVERMGGRVGVESERGKGSRFWVELQPAEPGAVAAPTTVAA